MPKILIVDDDVTITELMKALATMDGHEPTTVNDSLQAVEVANSVQPDLITLDLMMPGLTGFGTMIQNFQTRRSSLSVQKMTPKAWHKPNKLAPEIILPSLLAWMIFSTK
jgi:CheY-like chemotaxis protein